MQPWDTSFIIHPRDHPGTFHVAVDPRLHDSEHVRLLGGGVRRAALGAAMGIGRSAGPSQDSRRADAHQRRIGHLARHRAAAGRGTSGAVGIA